MRHSGSIAPFQRVERDGASGAAAAATTITGENGGAYVHSRRHDRLAVVVEIERERPRGARHTALHQHQRRACGRQDAAGEAAPLEHRHQRVGVASDVGSDWWRRSGWRADRTAHGGSAPRVACATRARVLSNRRAPRRDRRRRRTPRVTAPDRFNVITLSPPGARLTPSRYCPLPPRPAPSIRRSRKYFTWYFCTLRLCSSSVRAKA